MNDTRQIELIPSMPGFRTYQIDPPWLEQGGGQIQRGANRHYPLLPTREIPRVIMSASNWRPAVNAHCYLWATSNFLRDALWVMERIGFRYVTNAVWVKIDPGRIVKWLRRTLGLDSTPFADMRSFDGLELVQRALQIGLGQYFRGAHELLLFGVRGDGQDENLITPARNIPSVIFGKRGRHSAKPDNGYRMIEARSQGPYAEIFARSNRPGWEPWGNEIEPEATASAFAKQLHDQDEADHQALAQLTSEMLEKQHLEECLDKPCMRCDSIRKRRADA